MVYVYIVVTCVGNILKYGDLSQSLKVKDQDQNNADPQKVQRWNIDISGMTNQDQKDVDHDSLWKNIRILTKDWEKINKYEIK